MGRLSLTLSASLPSCKDTSRSDRQVQQELVIRNTSTETVMSVSILDQHFQLCSLTFCCSQQNVPDLVSTPTPQVWQEAVQPDQGAELLGRIVGREEFHTELSWAQAQYLRKTDVVSKPNLYSFQIFALLLLHHHVLQGDACSAGLPASASR